MRTQGRVAQLSSSGSLNCFSPFQMVIWHHLVKLQMCNPYYSAIPLPRKLWHICTKSCPRTTWYDIIYNREKRDDLIFIHRHMRIKIGMYSKSCSMTFKMKSACQPEWILKVGPVNKKAGIGYSQYSDYNVLNHIIFEHRP